MNNIKKNEARDIRQAEDSLFNAWASKRHPFATDGCADPELYRESRYKIVFALKERNWGHTIEDQRKFEKGGAKEIFDKREVFESWWTLMAQWADVLLPKGGVDMSWHQIQSSFIAPSGMSSAERETWINEKNRGALGKCACIQLKKSPGGGGLNKEDFSKVVEEDRTFLLRQLAIYEPHFIVSCGSNDSWSVFTRIIFDVHNVEQTKNGINYFIVQLEGNNHKTAVINFGHPSMRVNATLWGVLAFGLRETLEEIFPQLSST